jgi:hypothetical protein
MIYMYRVPKAKVKAIRSVGAEQSVSRYPFGVRRTPGFYLGGCVPPRAVFCLRILFVCLVVEPSMPISLACMLHYN